MNEPWIYPFQGRATYPYEADKLSFLWKSGITFIMDNHKAALWCWAQHLNTHGKYNLLHVDAHYDCCPDTLGSHRKELSDLRHLTIEEFLKLRRRNGRGSNGIPVVRWDNYLWVFLECYSDNLDQLLLAVNETEGSPEWNYKQELDDLSLLVLLDSGLSDGPWIVNLDLDYFVDQRNLEIMRPGYKGMFIELLRRQYMSGNIAVLTIAMSPPTCGGWAGAEALCDEVCKAIDVPFSLP